LEDVEGGYTGAVGCTYHSDKIAAEDNCDSVLDFPSPPLPEGRMDETWTSYINTTVI